MKSSILSLAVLGTFTLTSVSATAAPIKLSKAEMDQVVAGGQQHFPPGQFPAGNPGHAPGKSNTPGNSAK